MKKNRTKATNRIEDFKEDKLTIGSDLGDRFSQYCALDDAGSVILEHDPSNTAKGSTESPTGSRAVGSR